MKEQWRAVKVSQAGLKYEVSSNGKWRITNKEGKILQEDYGSDDRGYKNFGRLGKAHQVVAKAFIPNPKNKKEVNHIDGDKSNNKVSNLEWMTQSENMIHAYKNGLR